MECKTSETLLSCLRGRQSRGRWNGYEIESPGGDYHSKWIAAVGERRLNLFATLLPKPFSLGGNDHAWAPEIAFVKSIINLAPDAACIPSDGE